MWKEQCAVARGIRHNFGLEHALTYLIDGKYCPFFEKAAEHPEDNMDVVGFTAEISKIFTREELLPVFKRLRQKRYRLRTSTRDGQEFEINLHVTRCKAFRKAWETLLPNEPFPESRSMPYP